MPESGSCFFLSFHHLSYCMGHRFQARQQTIETGQEGVLCGFMGNNIYPRSCIELWVWVILIDSGWRKERLILCSGSQQLHGVFSFRPPLGVDLFFLVMSKCCRMIGGGCWFRASTWSDGWRLAVWPCSFFCFFLGVVRWLGHGLWSESSFSTMGVGGLLSRVICMDA